MANFTLEAADFDRLANLIKEFPDRAVDAINEILWDEGGQLINDAIMELLPRSGRSWSGKAAAAKNSAPFTQTNENLSVTVRTKGVYHYLYFPDDGSTTLRHEGGQEFMYRGAESEQDRIIYLCVANILHEL